ncbi:MAG: ferrous iron transport protein B [Bacteroidales bacterium]|nr:ferrous iron transport protein B [Bacteroidales bacterium]
MNLNEVAIDGEAVITKIKGRGTFRKRIMEMGFVKGKKVHVVKQAPLSDPIEYEIMGYHVSLRKSEAQMIEVVSMDHINEAALETSGENLTIEQIIANEIKDHGNIINVALVGNPNCGKTTFYNYASGSKERVGNYSGVTVDAKTAQFKYKDYIFNITDLPGTYSLTAYSAEEIYVRKFITDQNPDIVINMVDASNLERNMYLTTQLIDMDIKVVVALNMYDELEARGDKLDFISLGKMLGIPFVPVVSSKGKGFGVLFDSIIKDFEDKSPTHRHIHINYGNDIEKSIKAIQSKIFIHNDNSILSRIPSRFMALKLLEKDSDIESIVLANTVSGSHSHPENKVEDHSDNPSCIIDQAKDEIQKLEAGYKTDTETLIADTRYGFIAGALKETLVIGKENSRKLTDKIDRVITHKIWGFPIFLLTIFLMFQTTFTIGEYPMEWIENLVEWIGDLVRLWMPEGMLKDMVVDGIIGGVGGVIVFLPNIVILFMFISLMEDTGYMARVAFIMDKIMHKIGLHGKSFIPLIMGFGCNVPAIMATRTLENKSDRLLTMMISPYMSCSARLPLYTVMAAAFFSQYQAAISLSVYIIGIMIAALSAILLRKTVFKSQDAPFVMELPPYRIPTVRSVLKHMWEKAAQYLKKMGGVILIASIIIWALGYFPLPDKEMDDAERQEYSYIGRIGKFVEPAIEPLGFNWKLGISLFTGVAAKEIVVSTMGVLYHSDSENTESLSEKIKNDQSSGTPLTPYSAFGFMVFVLTYFPCIATATAMFKEGGQKRWGWLSITYSLILAWLLAFGINMLG